MISNDAWRRWLLRTRTARSTGIIRNRRRGRLAILLPPAEILEDRAMLAATMLAIGANQPTSGTAGQALTPALTVDVEDSTGHIVATDNSTVTLKVASGPAGLASGSTKSVAAQHGIATFSNLVLDVSGSYSLIVSDGSLKKATTGTITVSAAAATKLVFQQVPGSATAGQPLSPSVKVGVEDQFGNVVTTNISTVTLAVASGPGSFASGSTTSVAAVNGVANFTHVIFDKSGTYTLAATDGSLTKATSAKFTVSAAIAATLAFRQVPATGTAGQPLSPSVTVAVKDQFGNVVTSDSSMVTLAVAGGPGGFSSGSTTSVAATHGVATFSNLLLNTVGPYTLGASDGGLSAATSPTITIYTTISWINPNSGFWSNPLNWSSGQVPGQYDDVLINVSGNPTIYYDQGTPIHSLVSDDPFSIRGGSLSVATTVQVNSTFTLAGGTLSHSLILPGTGGQGLILTISGTLDGVTINANLDATDATGASAPANYANAIVIDGLTLNGTAYLGEASGATYGGLGFTDTETLTGTGTVVFGKNTGNNLSAAIGTTLTIGPGITIRGSSGSVGDPFFSEGTIINQGTISADDSGGAAGSFVYDTDFSGAFPEPATSAVIDTSAVTNPAPQSVYQTARSGNPTYTLPNLTPGGTYTVRLDFAELEAYAVGQKLMNVTINGTQVLTNFDIFATAGAAYKAVAETFTTTANSNGQIIIAFQSATFSTYQPTINGIELFSGTTRVLAINAGLMAGGTITIEPTSFINQGTVQATSTETFYIYNATNSAGSTISANGNLLSLRGPWTNAAGASITATGGTLELGDPLATSTNAWSNAGAITAAGATVNLGGLFTFAGLGTLNRPGSTVNLVGTLNNTGATLALGATTGSWNLVGGTITGGTLTETGGAELVIEPGPVYSANNPIGTLDGVKVDGNLDLSQFGSAYVDIKDGLTLNGTAFVGDGSGATNGGLYFFHTQTLSGTGTIVFGKSPDNFLKDDPLSGPLTLTIAPGITIRGSSGQIMYLVDGDTVVNQGKIIADDSGGAIGSFVYDTDFSGGYTGFTSAVIDTSGVTNPAPQTVYQTERTGGFTYTLPNLTPGGTYTVRLDFAELDASAAGQKLMNVTINGTQALTNFDIFATAGAKYKAVAETFTATANSNGQIVISFSAASGSNDGPSVNGIELFSGNTPVLAIDAGLLAGGTITVEPTKNFLNQGTLQVTNGETLDVSGLGGNVGVATLSGPGATLSLTGQNFTVDRGLSATTGETLDLSGTWTNAAGSTISANGATLGLFGAWTNAVGASITVAGGTFDVGDQTAAPSTNAWSNAGTITATGATVNLGGLFTLAAMQTINQTADSVNLVGILNNAGTTLALGPTTGYWSLLGGTIQGGTLTETGSAELIMTASGGTLDGVTVNGNLDLTEAVAASVGVRDGLTLNGTAYLGNALGTTFGQLLFATPETFGGTGTVVFGTYQFFGNAVGAYGSGSAALTIGPGITIRGSTGMIEGNPGNTLINQGIISADGGAGGSIEINPENDLFVLNQGTLKVSNGESLSIVGLNGNVGTATLSGTGSSLSLAGSYYARGYTVDQGLTVTAGQTLTLGGYWTNAAGSTITSTGATLNLGDPTDKSIQWSNSGTITASNSTVNLSGSFSLSALGTFTPTGSTVNLVGRFTNTGTTLALGPATGSWNLSGGAIVGGTITETGGAELIMTAAGGSLNGVTVNGNLDLTEVNGAYASIYGGLTLNGTAYLGAASGATYGLLYFTGTETLSGTGTIVFGTYGANNALRVDATSITLTIGPGIAIRGSSGTISSFSRDTVINQGTISADGSGGAAGGTITINPATFTNQGTLQVSNGEVINLNNFSPNAGVIHIGAGSVIDVTGNFTNASSGSVVIDIGGTSTSQFGRLAVTGTATLGGTLQVDQINGFSPVPGNAFEIMTFSSEIGTFSSILGWPYNVAYDPSDLTLSR